MLYTLCARRSNTRYSPEATRWNPVGSVKTPAMCAGSPPVDRSTSTRPAAPGDTANAGRDAISSRSTRVTGERARASVSDNFLNRSKNVGGLRKNRVLELGVVRNGAVEGRDPFHWRVEILEQLIGDACR